MNKGTWRIDEYKIYKIYLLISVKSINKGHFEIYTMLIKREMEALWEDKMYKIKSILTYFSYHCSLIIFRVNRLLESLLQNTDHIFKVFLSVAECTSGVLQVFFFFFLTECWVYSVESVTLFGFYPRCPLFYVANLWPCSIEFRLIFRDHERRGSVGFLEVLENAYKMILSFCPTDETRCVLFIWQQTRKETSGKYLKGKRERRYSWR